MSTMPRNQDGIEEPTVFPPDATPAPAADRIRSFKAFLATETERLRSRHAFGLGGREIAHGRSHVVDAVVSRACRMIAEDLGPGARGDLAGSAVVALGGYGRQELAPFSDVDLLFLHPGRLTRAAQEFLHAVLPLLWDVGLKVGHSVRSVPECIEEGLGDLHSRNSMSEARLVVGSPELFQRLERELLARVYGSARANRRFFKDMRAEFLERRERHGPVVGMLEPNVKEGAGGLRDLHTVGWVGLARYGLRGLEDLQAGGFVTGAERDRVLRAYDFLLRVRNELHFRSGRAVDVLALELQPELALGLGYRDQDAAAASETFMREFYFRAQEVQRFTDTFLRRTELVQAAPGRIAVATRARAAGPGKRFRILGRQLLPGPEGVGFGGDPLRLFEVFRVAQEHSVAVGAELKEGVRAQLHSVDADTRASHEAAAAFMALLRPVGRVSATFAEMHDTGLLARYLPEFENLTFMVQHDYYHKYTVDEHTLKALAALDDVARSEAQADSPAASLRDALSEVVDPARLTLALLLHDVGKGRGGGHVAKGTRIAADVCARLGLAQDVTEDVLFLVSKHLVMSRVSQRRDLTDRALLDGFAETVGTVDRLNMLYLLTAADIRGVGPGTWNEWKASLLADLHAKTLVRLAGDGHPTGYAPERVALEEMVLDDLHPEFLRSDVHEFLQHLPDRYVATVPVEDIAHHFEMTRELGSRPVVTHWRQSRKGPFTVLSVCLRDRPGVLSKIAGALTGSGLDILSVDIFTTDEGVVLDVFRVAESMGAPGVLAVPEERYEVIDADLAAAVDGRLDVAAAVERQRARQVRRRRRRKVAPVAVHFEEPEVPNGRTVIEVRADDEPGLVYRISTTLASLGIDISLAKIATEKSQALDVFYVTNARGSALLPDEQTEVERALVAALTTAG